jgi:hypothetical protein
MTWLVALVGGYRLTAGGALCLIHAMEPDGFWSWKLGWHIFRALLSGFFGAMLFGMTMPALVDRWHYRHGSYRCSFCDHPLKHARATCACLGMTALLQRNEDAIRQSGE